MYAVRLVRSARKELDALPDELLLRVARRIDRLAEDARPAGCKKLRGSVDLWRVRIGDYRIVYQIDDHAQVIEIRAIGDRKDIYG